MPIQSRCTGYVLQRKGTSCSSSLYSKEHLSGWRCKLSLGYNVVMLDPTSWDANSCLEDRWVIRGDVGLQSVCLQFSLFTFFLIPSITSL